MDAATHRGEKTAGWPPNATQHLPQRLQAKNTLHLKNPTAPVEQRLRNALSQDDFELAGPEE